MRKRNLLALGLLTTLLPCSWVAAEQVNVREEDINGVPHRVTTRIVKRPMSETKIVEREQEIYREEYTTDFQETSRIVQVPVTEYRWEAEWRNRWNPFSQPYMVQRLVPRTHWEMRSEIVKSPITQRRLVPETRIVQTPVTHRWMAEEEIVSKVALQPLDGSGSAGSLARKPSIGGTKLESDPPKSGGSSARRY